MEKKRGIPIAEPCNLCSSAYNAHSICGLHRVAHYHGALHGKRGGASSNGKMEIFCILTISVNCIFLTPKRHMLWMLIINMLKEEQNNQKQPATFRIKKDKGTNVIYQAKNKKAICSQQDANSCEDKNTMQLSANTAGWSRGSVLVQFVYQRN